MDIASQSYTSYGAARDAGALGKWKWLPSDLPESARDIREMHDVDTNEVWFSYQDPSGNAPSKCEKIRWADIRAPRDSRTREVAEFDRQIASSHMSGGQLYRCVGESYGYQLAVNPKSGRAYGWSRGDIDGHNR
ncbi:hypothetical protein AB4059_05125 [Lysobacter sp. 2RAF19]